MTPDTSGLAWQQPLAYYDPEACCWRTSGDMFLSAWPTSSQTCPAWGTTRAGELFALPTPELPTAEPGSSSLLGTPTALNTRTGRSPAFREGRAPTPLEFAESVTLLPTHRAAANRSSRRAMVDNQQWTAPSLEQALELAGGELPREFRSWDEVPGRSAAMEPTALLPTPTTEDHGTDAPGRTGGPSLSTAWVRSELLPTPPASDGEKGGPNQRGGAGDLRLSSAVHLLPTPTAMDSVGSRNSTVVRPPGSTANIGDTLTDAATVLTGSRTRAPRSSGASTPPPSPDGKPSPDAEHPGQLSLDDLASD